MEFSAAYEILSNRRCCDCPEHEKPERPIEGQTLEVGADFETSACHAHCAAPEDERKEPNSEDGFQASMSQLPLQELMTLAIQCQHERSETMNAFDGKLAALLDREELEAYPALVAETTAKFSVLSRTVRAVEGELQARKKLIPAKLLRRLQEQEKEHLTVTAALHMDQLRMFRSSRDDAEGHAKELQMLARSLEICEGSRADIRRNIQEVLDELRCEMDE
uniref:Uncharacterized protein n=1 Tax=Pinguiococcus pyrenoidosus TaxID=172671 RepID=A0A7R9YCH0_9STRA|eukprot:scaffold429_cov269-Pinguiococcus_pyrenoidosus.AAC.18